MGQSKNSTPSGSERFLPALKDVKAPPTPKRGQMEDQAVIELAHKVRDVEVQMVDFRAQLHKTIKNLYEEIPQRISAEVQNFFKKDLGQLNYWIEQQSKLREGMSALYQSVQGQSSSVFQDLQDVKHRLEVLEIQDTSARQNVDLIQQVHGNNGDKQFEMLIIQERQQRQIEQRALFDKIHQLEYKITQQQGEGSSQIVKVESDYIDRTQQNQRYVEQVLRGISSNVNDEIQHRNRSENEYKAWVEDRLRYVSENIRRDENQQDSRDRSIIHLIKEGLTALHDIINKSRLTGMQHTQKVQSSLTENLKDLTITLAGVKDQVFEKFRQVEQQIEEERQAMIYQQQSYQKAYNGLNDIIDTQASKLDSSIQTLENYFRSQLGVLYDENNNRDKKFDQWKKMFLDKLNKEFLNVAKAIDKVKQEQDILDRHCIDRSHSLREHVQRVNDEFAGKIESVYQKIDLEVEQLNHNQDKNSQLLREGFRYEMNEALKMVDGKLYQQIDHLDQQTSYKLDEYTQMLKVEMHSGFRNQENERDIRFQSFDIELKDYIQKIKHSLEEGINDLDNACNYNKNEISNLNSIVNENYDELGAKIRQSNEDVKVWADKNITQILQKQIKDEQNNRQLEDFNIQVLLSNEIRRVEVDISLHDTIRQLEQKQFAGYVMQNFQEDRERMSKQSNDFSNNIAQSEMRIMQELQDELKQANTRISENSEQISEIHENLENKELQIKQLEAKQEKLKQEVECQLQAQECMELLLSTLQAQEQQNMYHQIDNNIEDLHRKLVQTDLGLHNEMQELQSQVNDKIDSKIDDLMLHIDTIEAQQDIHTIAIEDISVKQTMNELVQSIETNEQVFIYSSVNIFHEQIPKYQQQQLDQGYELKGIKSTVEELQQNIDQLQANQAMEHLMSNTAEDNIFNALQRLGQAFDEFQNQVNDIEPAQPIDQEDYLEKLAMEISNLRQTIEQVQKIKGDQQDIQHSMKALQSQIEQIQLNFQAELEKSEISNRQAKDEITSELGKLRDLLENN